MAPGFESDILCLFNVSILSQSKTQQAWHVDTCPPMKRETTTNWSRKWADLNRTQTFHTIVHQPHWAWTCHKHKHHHKRQHHPLFVGSISQHPSATLQGDTFGTQALDEIPESSSTELAFLKNIFMETGGEEKKIGLLGVSWILWEKKECQENQPWPGCNGWTCSWQRRNLTHPNHPSLRIELGKWCPLQRTVMLKKQHLIGR